MPLVIGGFGSGLGGDDDGSDSEDGSQPSHPSSPREGSGESTGLAPAGGLSFGGGLNFDLSRPKSPGPSFLKTAPKSAARPSPAPRPSPSATSTPSPPVSTPRPSARPSTLPRPSTAPTSSVRPAPASAPASAPAARTALAPAPAPAPALSPAPAASASSPAAGLPFAARSCRPASVPDDGRSSPQVLGGQLKPAARPAPSRDSEANTLGTLLIRKSNNRPLIASPPAVLTSPAGPPSRELLARATARAGSSLVPKALTETAPGGLPAPAFSPEEVERAAAKATSTAAASPPPPPPTPTGWLPGPQDSACPSISEPTSITEPQGESPREAADLGSEPQQHTEPQAQPPSTDEIEHLVPPRTEPAMEIEEVETPPTRGAALVLAGPPRASSGLLAPRLGGLVAPGLLVAARPEAQRRLGPAAADPNAGVGRLQCNSSSTTSTFTLRAAAAAPASRRPAGSLGGGAPLSCFCVQAAQASSSLRSEGGLGGSEPSPRAALHNGGGQAAQRAVLGGPTILLTPAKQGPPPSLGLAGNPGSERVGLVGRSGGSTGSSLDGRVLSNSSGGGGGGGAIHLGSASQRASPYQRVVSTPSLSSSGARVSLLGSGTATAAAGEGGGGSSLALAPRALRGLQRTTSSVSTGGGLLSAGASPAHGAANPSLSLSRPQAPRPTLRSASQPAQLRSVSPLAPSQIDASAHSQVTVARGPGAHPPRPRTCCDPARAAPSHLPRAPSPCVRAHASRSCPSSTGSSSRCT